MIELSTLPPPQVVEELSFETILAAMRADLVERFPAIAPTLAIESTVVNQVLQVCAYRELLIRARINDAARSTMLAFASSGDLDQIGGTFGVPRLIVVPANGNVAAIMESDERFRRRIQLGIIAYSVAGPIEAYIFHALTADPTILDAAVNNPHSNRIELTVLSAIGTGAASADQLTAVAEALSPNTTRPLTDDLSVRAATIIEQNVSVTLHLPSGPSPTIIREAAAAAIRAYCDERHRIGKVLRVDGIIAAARSGGRIERAVVTSPASDVDPGIAGAVYVPTVTVVSEIVN